MVYKSAGEGPRTPPEELERLAAIRDEDIDTSDIPEWDGEIRDPVRRDANGRLIEPDPGPIARAILKQLGRLRMTRYALWKAARERCPTLSQSAVYGFLRGDRDIGVAYLEAILGTLGLTVGRRAERRAPRPAPAVLAASAAGVSPVPIGEPTPVAELLPGRSAARRARGRGGCRRGPRGGPLPAGRRAGA